MRAAAAALAACLVTSAPVRAQSVGEAVRSLRGAVGEDVDRFSLRLDFGAFDRQPDPAYFSYIEGWWGLPSLLTPNLSGFSKSVLNEAWVIAEWVGDLAALPQCGGGADETGPKSFFARVRLPFGTPVGEDIRFAKNVYPWESRAAGARDALFLTPYWPDGSDDATLRLDAFGPDRIAGRVEILARGACPSALWTFDVVPHGGTRHARPLD